MDVSGVVLAGGLSRRLGRDKAVEPFQGEPLIARVIGRLSSLTNEIVVVVNSEKRAKELPLPAGVKIAVDVYPDSGSLGGIFTGLTAAANDWAFVTACDMPFLNESLISHLLTSRDGFHAIVPVLDGYPEPTHSAYSKDCLPHMERRLEARQLRISGFFDDVEVNYVAQDEIESLDPERLSFMNINTPEDLKLALEITGKDI